MIRIGPANQAELRTNLTIFLKFIDKFIRTYNYDCTCFTAGNDPAHQLCSGPRFAHCAAPAVWTHAITSNVMARPLHLCGHLLQHRHCRHLCRNSHWWRLGQLPHDWHHGRRLNCGSLHGHHRRRYFRRAPLLHWRLLRRSLCHLVHRGRHLGRSVPVLLPPHTDAVAAGYDHRLRGRSATDDYHPAGGQAIRPSGAAGKPHRHSHDAGQLHGPRPFHENHRRQPPPERAPKGQPKSKRTGYRSWDGWLFQKGLNPRIRHRRCAHHQEIQQLRRRVHYRYGTRSRLYWCRSQSSRPRQGGPSDGHYQAVIDDRPHSHRPQPQRNRLHWPKLLIVDGHCGAAYH